MPIVPDLAKKLAARLQYRTAALITLLFPFRPVVLFYWVLPELLFGNKRVVSSSEVMIVSSNFV